MSKKKFTEGLESIFGDATEDSFRSSGLVLTEEPDNAVVQTTPARKKTKSRKNFTTDLDSLFEDALKETIIEKTKETEKGLENKTKSSANKSRPRKPLTGLDALIRRTVETSTIEIDETAKKRVTFVFEKRKLERLKKIARIEKSYLKDILSDIVSEYLEKYEQAKMNLEN